MERKIEVDRKRLMVHAWDASGVVCFRWTIDMNGMIHYNKNKPLEIIPHSEFMAIRRQASKILRDEFRHKREHQAVRGPT